MADISGDLNAQDVNITDPDNGFKATVDSDNRLLVAAKLDSEVDVNYAINYVLNGADPALDTNGAAVNQNFTYTPSSGIRYIDKITFFIHDSGTADPQDYGSITNGLTNGLLFQYQSLGVLRTLFTVFSNSDIISFLNDCPIYPSSGSQFLNNSDVYCGSLTLRRPITLNSADGDFFRVVVRDNLTAITFNRVSVLHWGKS